MTTDRTARPHLASVPGARGGAPSATRSASSRRQRLREELRKGNVNALKHGVFAIVLNAPDIAVEVELVYVANPHLDPIADRRLVEQLATASVHYARATVALTASNEWAASITAAARDFGNRAERLERAVHQRDQERAKAAAGKHADLSQYRAGTAS